MFSETTALSEFKKSLEHDVEKTRSELLVLKTGKASPALVENLFIETYGGSAKLRLMELATIATEGVSALLISPFDPSTIADIERAILASPLNLTPRVDGKDIHIKIPALTEEQRLKLLKTVSQKIEEAKVMMRTKRDDIRKKIRHAFDAKELSEDQKFRFEKEIDQITHEYTTLLDDVKAKKEKEMMVI